MLSPILLVQDDQRSYKKQLRDSLIKLIDELAFNKKTDNDDVRHEVAMWVDNTYFWENNASINRLVHVDPKEFCDLIDANCIVRIVKRHGFNHPFVVAWILDEFAAYGVDLDVSDSKCHLMGHIMLHGDPALLDCYLNEMGVVPSRNGDEFFYRCQKDTMTLLDYFAVYEPWQVFLEWLYRGRIRACDMPKELIEFVSYFYYVYMPHKIQELSGAKKQLQVMYSEDVTNDRLLDLLKDALDDIVTVERKMARICDEYINSEAFDDVVEAYLASDSSDECSDECSDEESDEEESDLDSIECSSECRDEESDLESVECSDEESDEEESDLNSIECSSECRDEESDLESVECSDEEFDEEESDLDSIECSSECRDEESDLDLLGDRLEEARQSNRTKQEPSARTNTTECSGDTSLKGLNEIFDTPNDTTKCSGDTSLKGLNEIFDTPNDTTECYDNKPLEGLSEIFGPPNDTDLFNFDPIVESPSKDCLYCCPGTMSSRDYAIITRINDLHWQLDELASMIADRPEA